MIELKLSATGESLDLFPDTSLPLEINNPLFPTDQLIGTYTYPFDLPLTPKNRQKLGFPEALLNRASASPSVNMDLFFAGILYKKGVLKILKITDRISCSFIAGAGSINDLIKDKKLADINYGTFFFPAEGSLALEFVSYNEPGFGGRVGNPMHLTLNITYSGVTTEFGKFISGSTGIAGDVASLVAAFNADTAGMTANHIVSVTGDVNESVLPYFYRITFALATGAVASVNMDKLGVAFNSYKSSFWKTTPSAAIQPKADFMKAISLLSYPACSFTFFPVKNEGFYASDNADYGGHINDYNADADEFYINITSDGSRCKYPICPFPYFLHIFKTVFSSISYIVNGSFLDDDNHKKLVIYNTQALDSILFDSVTPTTIILNKWADSFDLKNHVPEMLITDFLNFVKRNFCLGYFIDDSKKTVEVILLADVIKSAEYDDYTSITNILKEIDLNDGSGYTLKLPDTSDQYLKDNLKDLSSYKVKAPVVNSADLDDLTDQQADDVRLVTSLDEYWKLTQTYDGSNVIQGWVKFSDNYFNFIVGDGKNEVALNINTLLTIKEADNGGNWLIPVTNEEGSSNEFGLGNNNKDKLRLLIYYGYKDDSAMQLYPFGTNGYKDYAGDQVGSLSLKLDDRYYGINKKYYTDWITFLASTKSVIATTQLDLKKLMDVNLLKRKKRIDNVTYLINKINVTLTMTGIKPATVQYYKV